MTGSATRTYAGKTAAERVAERRAALVRTAFGLIAEHGWAAVAIDRVCREAALNKRYFYESFADPDELVAAVIDTLAADAITATVGAMDPSAPRPVLVRAGIGALIHHLTDDPRRARVLMGEGSGSDAVARHRTEALHRVVAAAIEQGRAVHVLPDDAAPVIDLAGALLVGGTRQAVLDWLDGRLHDDVERFVEDLAALWLVAGESAAAIAGRTRGA
jgi:AcrR family transcriptional regulator